MTKRALCHQCQRPENACICQFITLVDNNIHVVVLQHPSEVSQTKGTVALLAKSLQSCQVIVGEDFTNDEQLQQVITQYQALLLYPSENSQELSMSLNNLPQSHLPQDKQQQDNHQQDKQISKQTIDGEKPYCLIILDGTWKKAYKMFMLCQILKQIPQICLPESLANSGQYQIRKVAKRNALSSLEACCYALTLLEGTDKYQKLITQFVAFNQFQLSFRPKHHLSKHQVNSLGKK